ncbi:hypothetical protein VUR80DRAFT_4137 [Thermomyces stellatus]
MNGSTQTMGVGRKGRGAVMIMNGTSDLLNLIRMDSSATFGVTICHAIARDETNLSYLEICRPKENGDLHPADPTKRPLRRKTS